MNTPIKKILVISLSNIGDVILTFPVMDILKRDFPDAQIDVIVGPKGESLIAGNPAFLKVYVYHKNQSPWALLLWMKELAQEKYDLVVDLRNTAIPFLIFAKKKTPIMFRRPKGVHMRQQHLTRLQTVHPFDSTSAPKVSLFVSPTDVPNSKYVVIAPGSRAENKRWSEQGFAQLADYLVDHYGLKIVFVGDDNDVVIARRIAGLMKHPSLDLTATLTLPQTGYLMSEARLAVVNDSAPAHLASYLNVPVVTFFGPTDPDKYGPWSEKNLVIRKNSNCAACKGDDASPHDCVQAITFEDAVKVMEPWLGKIFDGK